MEDVNISIYRASVVREGSTPASPGFVVSDGQNPVDPSGSGQNHLPVTIATAATGLSITESQVLGGAGNVGQYIRGDGSLADFPESSGGGSSVSYYLNGSVAQGTIGGVAYKELNKVPILGAGTDFTINADGYIASFITDAGDPNLLEIPGGNWNFETYFSASSSGGTPTFYVELYKVNSGGTATLIASNSGFPELIAFGTNIISYFSTLAVPTTALALTDRLAIRYYVTHSGRTITLHTEDNHLCQIITTFTTGITALNGLTAQVQNFAVGTSGTDFNIASATATHTFNLPTASATNRGALSSADWSMFNAKQNALGYTPVPETRTLTINGTTQDLSANRTFNVGDMLLDTIQTVTARKDYNSNTLQLVVNGTSQKTILTNSPIDTGSYSGLINAFGFNASNNLYFSKGANNNGIFAFSNAATRTYTLKDASGTLAFTSDIPSLSGYVQGSGTTNYLPKFTGASAIGNSLVFDNGTQVGINTNTIASDFGLALFGSKSLMVFQNSNTGQTNSDGFIVGSFGGTEAYLFNYENAAIIFGTNGQGRMRIFDDGNVFIGSSPSNAGYKLEVNGNVKFNGIMSLENDGTYGSTYKTLGFTGNSNGSHRIFAGTADNIYIAAATARGIQFWVNGTNDAMYIASSGNVGIGTVSPSYLLDTVLNQNASTILSVSNNISNTAAYAAMRIGSSNNVWLYNFSDSYTTSGRFAAGTFLIDSSATNGVNINAVNGILSLSTANNKILNITTGGNVLIGTTSQLQSTERLAVTSSSNAAILAQYTGGATTGWAAKFWNNATSGDNLFIEFVTETSITARGSVTYNRGSGVTAYNTTSDYRIKTEISDFNSLNIISNLKPQQFRIGNATRKTIGFIAHELQEFFPQAVTGIKDQIDNFGNPIYQSVDYSQLTGLLVKAIQELKQEIDTLKN